MVRNDVRDEDAWAEPASATPPGPAGCSPALGDVTQILSAIQQGDGQATEQLLPLVYEELRKLAATRMAEEKPGQTLQATALVHEAYIRLVDQALPQRWDSRGHFFAAAAEAMRRILVEQARRKAGPDAGGGRGRVDISSAELGLNDTRLEALLLSDALDQLATKDRRKADLVKLRFFAGLTMEQAAQVLGISLRTAYDDWAYAKCWLRVEMSES